MVWVMLNSFNMAERFARRIGYHDLSQGKDIDLDPMEVERYVIAGVR